MGVWERAIGAIPRFRPSPAADPRQRPVSPSVPGAAFVSTLPVPGSATLLLPRAFSRSSYDPGLPPCLPKPKLPCCHLPLPPTPSIPYPTPMPTRTRHPLILSLSKDPTPPPFMVSLSNHAPPPLMVTHPRSW